MGAGLSREARVNPGQERVGQEPRAELLRLPSRASSLWDNSPSSVSELSISLGGKYFISKEYILYPTQFQIHGI